ncbi:MAG: hypothetical protein ASARMPRED_002306 [Alectoria sarmentosa]|nr:MAG: hypothetical protein ASARMPRED_002306 [Alectoria sarmentosa]
MSPNASGSLHTFENRAAPNPNDAGVELSTSNLHPASTYNNSVQRPESSRASGPPSYTRTAPLDDPFRDGDTPVGYFDPNRQDVQEGLKPATATHEDPPAVATADLVDSPPPESTADADADVEMVLDESLLSPPPLPPRPSALKRGLQIPSRFNTITWGFSFPNVLAEQGVTELQWKWFKRELKAFASMSKSQWATILLCSNFIGYHLAFPVGTFIGAFVHHKMQKNAEHANFLLAYQSGIVKAFEDRWNDHCFRPLGLQIRVEPPGIGKMNGMDVASSKLFRYQQQMGISSPAPGIASRQGDEKEYKYQSKEDRYRMKAARKVRIVVLPLSPTKGSGFLFSPQTMTGLESHNDQSQGITTRAGPSVQDLAGMNQKLSGYESQYRTRTTA